MDDNGRPVLEYLILHWDAKRWFKEHNAPLLKVARQLRISDSAIHLWQKRDMTPLSFFKAAVMLVDPEGALDVLKRAKASEVTRGFNVTNEMRHYAHQYDVKFAGQRISLKTGGHVVVTPDNAPILEPTSSPSGPRALDVPGTPHIEGTVDTLLTLALKLKLERDEMMQRCALMESQLRMERARVEAAQKHIEALRKETAEWQQLAEQASSPVQDLAPVATPQEREHTAKLVASRSQSLAEELERLPKQKGH